MKHFMVSLIIFSAILVGSVFSHSYTSNALMSLNVQAKTLTESESINVNTLNRTKSIKDNFLRKKNTLQFFLNKEHILDIESKILLLESAVKNDEPQGVRENSIELICLLEHADSSLFALK